MDEIDSIVMLVDQGRIKLAIERLEAMRRKEANDPIVLGWLGICLAKEKRADEAIALGKEAVGLYPDWDLLHFTLARIYDTLDQLDLARTAIDEAIRLDPDAAHNHMLLASILAQQLRWTEALAATEEALRLDPEDVQAMNIRSIALRKLGRAHEAAADLDLALALDPLDGTTHSSKGWALLETNEIPKAIEHFREALRIDPTDGSAREGITEAMKARNPLYRIALRFFLWSGRFSNTTQIAIAIGLVVALTLLRRLLAANPHLAPVIMPAIVLLLGFAILTFVADPLFNLVLACDKVGRMALTEDKLLLTKLQLAALLPAIILLIAGYFLGSPEARLWGFAMLLLVLPPMVPFEVEKGPQRRQLTYLAIACAVAIVAGTALRIAGWPAGKNVVFAGAGVCMMAHLWPKKFVR